MAPRAKTKCLPSLNPLLSCCVNFSAIMKITECIARNKGHFEFKLVTAQRKRFSGLEQSYYIFETKFKGKLGRSQSIIQWILR